ncbi:hypothetical protein [Tautonia marina]|uniref:hypothetical protein n=1 Tax=Tautonia marina TaxID=2653855 RepID=UPI001260C157|nr:hypothetical protein [Tautonia marina]
MADWVKKPLRLKDEHGRETRVGCDVLVTDRSAVPFDYPDDWVVIPDDHGTLRLHDRQPPDDDCTLQMTIFDLNPNVDWSRLSLSSMIETLLQQETRFVLERGEIITFQRGPIEAAWSEIRFMDPNEARPAFSRTCLVRCGTLQPLITFDFWENDAPRCRQVWDTILATLRIDGTLIDPADGPTQRDRGKPPKPGRREPR